MIILIAIMKYLQGILFALQHKKKLILLQQSLIHKKNNNYKRTKKMINILE